VRVLVVGISGLPFGSPKTKNHLDVALVESYKIYYKGEGGGFPQVRVVVSLVSLSCPWLVLAPKVFQLCSNCPMLVLCRFVWIIKACQFFLVPSRNSNTPIYLSKVLRTRERPWVFALLLFSVWDSYLSPSRSWERMKEDMKHLKFQDNRSPNFETPTWESWEKVPFGCNPFKESQNIL
jgi:hypothetical protein